MNNFLNDTGLGHLISKIKSTFFAKTDSFEVVEVDVDAVPTANSENLVTSGGVKAYVDSTATPSPGTLNTSNTVSQTTSSSESLSGAINLHKVSKTGSFEDLVDVPVNIIYMGDEEGTVYYIEDSS